MDTGVGRHVLAHVVDVGECVRQHFVAPTHPSENDGSSQQHHGGEDHTKCERQQQSVEDEFAARSRWPEPRARAIAEVTPAPIPLEEIEHRDAHRPTKRDVGGNAVRGTGNMSLHAGVLVGCVVAHIVLSPLLIFGWGPVPALGPAGAGWGPGDPLCGREPDYDFRDLCSLGLNRAAELPRPGPSIWESFADILKVGVPGLVNTAITNLSIVILTGIAGQFGPEAAIGYAMGARLEYIMQPIAFGFGTAIVAMVGTNPGVGQYHRARQIAWTGALAIAAVWRHDSTYRRPATEPLAGAASSNDPEVERIGAQYLRIVGPAYLCFGLGLGLFFVSQGFGRRHRGYDSPMPCA